MSGEEERQGEKTGKERSRRKKEEKRLVEMGRFLNENGHFMQKDPLEVTA